MEIVSRHRRAGRSVLVIRQPDGTLAQVPTWMCEPAAAALSVKDRPRVALAACATSVSLLTRRYRRSPVWRKESGLRRIQVARQGELLVETQPGPALPTQTRATLLPLVATLLLEAVAPATVTRPEEAEEMEGSDEQDHP